MNWTWLDWAAVALLGGVVGASELISRYKDEPRGGRPELAGVVLRCNQQRGLLRRPGPDPR
jgi:hypothetical protein